MKGLGRQDTRGLLRIIGGLALPVVLANISQTLMGLVDTLMVGRLGTDALAAVGVATLIYSGLATPIKSLDVAVQTFAARRVGQGRDREVGAVLLTGSGVAVAVGLFFTLVGMKFPGFLMGLSGQTAAVDSLGVTYLMWRFPGLLAFLLFFMQKATFDGIGRMKLGMWIGVGMNVCNALLNWMFIFGRLGAPEMGVAGAALASTLSSTLAAIVFFGVALAPDVRRRYRLISRSNFRPDLLKPFLRIAWPPAVQAFGALCAVLVFFGILGRISTLAVAAGNIVFRIAALSFMPGFGIGVAVQTAVGQCLGRGDVRGAVRGSWAGVLLSLVFMGMFGVLFWAWPTGLMRVFTDSEELARAGAPVLRLMGLVQVVDAVGLTLAGALRGAGATRQVMIVDVAAGLLLLLPTAWICGVVLGGGLTGAWLGVLAWFTFYAIGMTVWFLRGNWQKIKI